jgi:hypothetical protein
MSGEILAVDTPQETGEGSKLEEFQQDGAGAGEEGTTHADVAGEPVSSADGHESNAPHFVAPSSYLRPVSSRAQGAVGSFGGGSANSGSRPGTRDSRQMTPFDREQIEGLVSLNRHESSGVLSLNIHERG